MRKQAVDDDLEFQGAITRHGVDVLDAAQVAGTRVCVRVKLDDRRLPEQAANEPYRLRLDRDSIRDRRDPCG